MLPRIHVLRSLAWTALLGAGLPAAQAQLVSSSPFMAPQGSGPNPTQGAPLEWRGYISTPEGTQYIVYDPARKLRSFLKVNEKDSTLDVVVKQFDSDNNMLTIEYQGKALTLEERKAKIVSSGNAAAMPPPQPLPAQAGPQVMPAVTQSVVVNPTPAEEQRRLEAVAAEVARRRALREQAQTNMPQQVAIPQPGQPQQMPQMQQPQVEVQRKPQAQGPIPMQPGYQGGRPSQPTQR
ncbi:MAG TPA: hypothetical protein VM029_17285 [Opitutaceae bacterium]|nr:hypothetical protein [Opitutaceae bacterium]